MNSTFAIIASNSPICAASSAGGSLDSPCTCLGLVREVGDLDVAVRPSPHAEPTQQVRPKRGGVGLELLIEGADLVTVHLPALHDLHEAGIVRATGQEAVDVVRVGEPDLAVEALLGLRPPLTLLWTFAVGLGVRRRLEPGERHRLTAVGHTGRRPEEPSGSRTQLAHPSFELTTQPFAICDTALNRLHEHIRPPLARPPRAIILPARSPCNAPLQRVGQPARRQHRALRRGAAHRAQRAGPFRCGVQSNCPQDVHVRSLGS